MNSNLRRDTMKLNKNYLSLALGIITLLGAPKDSLARPKIQAGKTYCDCSCGTADTKKELSWEKVASCALNGRSCKADGKPGTLANCQECKGDSSGGFSTCNDAKKRTISVSPVLAGKLLSGLALEVATLQSQQSIPDLVPLTAPGTVAPEGYCQRNNQGQLIVKVYNQGFEDADPSKTTITFGAATPQSVTTPAIPARGETELVVDIPSSCFDGSGRCSFTIAVDRENVLAESDEVNNAVAGVCGAQFQ